MWHSKTAGFPENVIHFLSCFFVSYAFYIFLKISGICDPSYSDYKNPKSNLMGKSDTVDNIRDLKIRYVDQQQYQTTDPEAQKDFAL